MGMTWSATAMDPARAAALLERSHRIEEALYEREDAQGGQDAYLDKAWHAIHFVLTGSAWAGEAPWAWAVFGGSPVGEDDADANWRHLPAEQVRQVAQALAELPPAEFAARYDAQALADAQIYPDVIWLRDGDEAKEYVLDYYAQLSGFYAAAARRGDDVFATIG
ncbi:YfbM family protein [Lysobacter sp. K5869]|uniref:YfbM family protein n=1 Tax=Lysobacter sp. K5869 TaxID=2820808 RepID=UPI001C0637FB|nr:YfbM family protein [Lysobacter sp. K5869]QWP76020.1 YfbM family protein [Lysobacter sp. K5869]